MSILLISIIVETEVWTGDRRPEQSVQSREIRIEGAQRHVARLWNWLGSSAFAPTRRQAAQMVDTRKS